MPSLADAYKSAFVKKAVPPPAPVSTSPPPPQRQVRTYRFIGHRHVTSSNGGCQSWSCVSEICV
jgi:hypothetical protein